MKLLTYTLPVALLFTAAVAQTDPTTGLPQQPSTGSQRPESQDRTRTSVAAPVESDRVVSAMVLTCNTNEIALARLAGQRSANDEVKQFAQKLIKDHTELVTKLQTLAGRDSSGLSGKDRNSERIGSGDGKGERNGERGGENSPESSGDSKRLGDNGSGRASDASMRNNEFDHLGLIRELGAKNLETSTRMLTAKSGAEFDICYMQMAVYSHTHAVDALSVFTKHASPELRSTLEGAKSTMQAHLDHAERISKSLDKGVKSEGSGEKDPAGRGR